MPPIRDPQVSSMLQRALSNRVLSEAEAQKLAKAIEKDGVTPAEVSTVVSALTEALASDGLDLGTATRAKNLDKLLARLDDSRSTGLGGGAPPAGSMSFVDALVLRASGGALPPRGDAGDLEERPLPKPSFAGKAIDVEADGRILVDGAEVPLDPTSPSTEQMSAVMGLVTPGNLDVLTNDEKHALAGKLLTAIDAGWPVAADGDTAFKRTVITTTAVGALRQLAPAMDAGQLDTLLAALDKAPNTMAKTLCLDVLEHATLTDAQRARKDATAAPEHKDALLAAWDEMAKGEARFQYAAAEGPVQEVGLMGLCFAKAPGSMEGLYAGLAVFKDLNPGGRAFDAEESGHLARLLEGYVHKHGALEYVFGTFEQDMPRELAKLTNARVSKGVMPRLEGTSPRLGDVSLTRAQADFVKKLVSGLKDDGAVDNLERALKEAALLTSTEPRGYGDPATSASPPTQAAFELFQRIAQPHLDGQEATADGMIAMSDLLREVRSGVAEIREVLTPRLVGLTQTPPSWNGIEVAPETASTLVSLVNDRLRSTMSVTNLDKGLAVVAEAHGGKVTGAAADVFSRVVTDYISNWPNLTTFDFNKLERIAKFAVEGRDVPLCSLNGTPVGLAEFYGRVAQAVTDSVDRGLVRHEWMAHRWGFRAKEAVELLDVVAEKTARDEGPVAALQRQFPGKQIEVHATGLDGVHQQFLYHVKDGSRLLGVYNEGSDGKVAAYTDRKDPVLFTATVNDDGSFDVKVPGDNPIKKYPLQTTYGVGDSVDVAFLDSAATEVRTEGDKFDTRYKIVEGTILGFDNAGNYEVGYKKPDGTEVKEKLPLSKLTKVNHPHYFSEDGSYLRDVEINLKRDEPLKKFLEGADPIIQRYLPTDGSLAGASATELANLQRKCVDALMDYADENMKYPRDKSSTGDANSVKFWELDAGFRFPLGELVKINRGVCRHQCIAEHLLLQRAGIDSRLASGAANTSSGNYRGLHLWVELSLADNSRWLSDQTWKDPSIPLWSGAYDVDKRRVEIYNRTADFDGQLPS